MKINRIFTILFVVAVIAYTIMHMAAAAQIGKIPPENANAIFQVLQNYAILLYASLIYGKLTKES